MAATTTSTITEHVQQSAKRTRAVFLSQYGTPVPDNPASQRLKLSSKVADEYAAVIELPSALLAQQQTDSKTAPVTSGAVNTAAGPANDTSKLVDNLNVTSTAASSVGSSGGMALVARTATATIAGGTSAMVPVAGSSSTAIALRMPNKVAKPKWHPPWKLMRVIAGHLGWVRSIAVDPTNEWFVTGSADKTIKIWDLASGQLKLTLTGHINTVRGVCVSDRHPYLFSVGDDKLVKCWDLEVNKVIRHYHGHLSGVYTVSLHPTLDVLFTGGRDSTVRVWDVRTKQNVHVMTGHTNTVANVVSQAVQPQVISGSMDSTVRLWDLAAGKALAVLTNHKKSVRALAINPSEYTFASGAPDNIKQWKCPEGTFLQNLAGHNAIINTISINSDDVLFSGADNGTMCFWDYKSGYNFQRTETVVQPGSLDSEKGIFASTFDRSGSRLITCEADKTIKIWKEDDSATEQTHPIEFKALLRRSRW